MCGATGAPTMGPWFRRFEPRYLDADQTHSHSHNLKGPANDGQGSCYDSKDIRRDRLMRLEAAEQLNIFGSIGRAPDS